MATSQPIALPQSNLANSSNDYNMGSYSGSLSGQFNPASYTRHFLGSPISWRPGSFGGRFPQGSPSAQLFSSLDHPTNSSSKSVQVMNAFNVFDREGELCRNYTCCGVHLPDLHALLEHFEEVHVLVVDPTGPPQIQIPFNPQFGEIRQPPVFDTDDMELELDLDNSTQPPQLLPSSVHSSPSSAAPSPPQHQYSQYHPSFPTSRASPYSSNPPSPSSNSLNSHIQPVGVHFPHAGPGTPAVMAHPEEAFNSYARFAADYSSHMPGTQLNVSGGDEIVVNGLGLGEYPDFAQGGGVGRGATNSQGQRCIPPALLFSSSSSPSPTSSPTTTNQEPHIIRSGSSRKASPSASSPAATSASKLKLKVRGPSLTSTTSSSSTTPSTAGSTAASTPIHTPPHTPLPPTTSLLLSKPFRCPKPNCNKSYKQANGLKYHMTHGSCNFAPPKDLEHVKDLLEIKRREREANGGLARSASVGARPSSGTEAEANIEPVLMHPAYGDLGAITEMELREVEREAEKRLRPFACGVGDCQRRYKNMNGLRYHYQHSGDHGAVGLALLAGGVSECFGNYNNNGTVSNGGSGGNVDGGKGKGKTYGPGYGADERERRRGGTSNNGGGVHRSAGVIGGNSGGGVVRGGSASLPVSRAGSVSRVGTPVSSPPSATLTAANQLPYVTSSGATTPFTPAYTNPGPTNGANLGGRGKNPSPPLTPLTIAVQGLELLSQPRSPTRNPSFQGGQNQSPSQSHRTPTPLVPPTQQQLTYQAQFAELQRRQYVQFQQRQDAFVQQQARHAQYLSQQQQIQMDYGGTEAQREFITQMHEYGLTRHPQ